MKKTILFIASLVLLTLNSLAQTVTDYDGNVYSTVTIGTQIWMKENLRVTHYNNGIEIPKVSISSDWASLSTGARCYYNSDSTKNALSLGALYNFYAVENTNKLCPTGWHVPSDSEFTVLVDYLGGASVAGSALKEIGLTHWNSPNTDATNSSSFTGIGAGMRGYETGSYASKGGFADFWTSTPTTIGNSSAKSYVLYYNKSNVGNGWSDKKIGFSVRCMSDIPGSNPIYKKSQTKTLCEGESFEIGIHSYFESGTYIDSLTSIEGWDSVVTTQLIVNPSYDIALNKTIKSNETFTVGSQTFSQSGTYLINLQTLMGCDSVITLQLTVETLSGINETTQNPVINIYPNPTSQDLNLNITGIATVEIYSTNGILIFKRKITDCENIDVSSFTKGSYIVKINMNNSIITKTLVIE